MPSFHRIIWFHNQIINNEYPNAKGLSEAFEISVRQSQRDIEYLRDSLNAPLDYSPQKHGYKYSQEYSLPVFFLSNNEKQLLVSITEKYQKLGSLGYGEYIEKAKILSKVSQADTPAATISKEPYIAQIQYLSERKRTSILECFPQRHLCGNTVEYTFFDAEIFITALLASGLTFRIVNPKWLKEYIKARLDEIIKVL